MISTDSKCQDKSTIANNKMSATHSGAFIDLNMDCRPDLFIEANDASGKRMVETYFFEDGDKFCLVSVDTFPDKAVAMSASSFSFIDLMRMGSNHGIVVDSSNNLHAMINKYNIPNPTDTSSSLCKGQELLGTDKKHLPPFDGITKFAQSFTDVSV